MDRGVSEEEQQHLWDTTAPVEATRPATAARAIPRPAAVCCAAVGTGASAPQLGSEWGASPAPLQTPSGRTDPGVQRAAPLQLAQTGNSPKAAAFLGSTRSCSTTPQAMEEGVTSAALHQLLITCLGSRTRCTALSLTPVTSQVAVSRRNGAGSTRGV